MPPDTFRFDFHGIHIDVHGSGITQVFQREYGRLAVPHTDERAHVTILPSSERLVNAIRPKGISKGIRIVPQAEGYEVLYDRGLHAGHIMGWVESLLRWPDKALAHAAAVARGGKASVFFAGPNTGKTTTVLRLVQEGYDYLSDDWVVIGDGKAYPVPKTIKVFDYNLAADGALCTRIMPGPLPWHSYMKGRLFLKNRVAPRLPSRALRFAVTAYLARMVRPVDIIDLHPAARVSPPAAIKDAIWLSRHEGDRFQLDEEEPDLLADRIVNAALHERALHLGRFALDSALTGKGFDMRAWLDHIRTVSRAAVRNARCAVLKIPRQATPEELLPEIRRLIER